MIAAAKRSCVDPVLLAITRVQTFLQGQRLSGASGFFYETEARLFVVTSSHVLYDPATRHAPDRISIELHSHESDFTQATIFSVPLYRDGKRLWRRASDSAGDIDVAAIEIDRGALPASCAMRAFDASHLQGFPADVPIASALAIVGFPLGFHDTVHHLPVARQAALASSFGMRFQGQGLFLTDARTHRGSSGAPVLMSALRGAGEGDMHWKLLGIHSSRMDMTNRDLQDESLGLNCAWYADVLPTLTA